MWPQALQMTRDECRGLLRRLELESYSQVVSVFRAQGGLSEAKAKLLEELRCVFHISNERHRAEARRVANDEQLATIAEAISGPNTWQEWSREGRRPYSMLPRVVPQTALALLANNVAAETIQENSKLPYPTETADIKEELLHSQNQNSCEALPETNNVVINDPFKMPDMPQNPKKSLKRNLEHQNSGSGKKRSSGDNSAQHAQTTRKNYPHVTANSPQTNLETTYSMNMGNDCKQKLNVTDQHIEKQRFFHRQHQIAKQKIAKKTAVVAAAAAHNSTMIGCTLNKRQTTPAKSGRRTNQKVQQKLGMKQVQMDIQQQQVPMQIDLTGIGVTEITAGPGASTAAQAILTQQQLDMQFVTYATQHQPPQQIFKEKDMEVVHSQLSAFPAGIVSTVPITSSNQCPPSLINALSSPQIAASKRDISKNLNKLQLQQNQHLSSNASNVPSVVNSPANMLSHDLQTNIGTILSSSTISASSSTDKTKPNEKSLISTTPVQKYIVEERQPGVGINLPTCANSSTLVNLQNTHGSTPTSAHIIQVSNAGQQQQIMSYPQISAAATKLRAVNTTLIAPGSKMVSTPTKKVTSLPLNSSSSTNIGTNTSSVINAGALHALANVASTQSQVLHIVEDGGNNPINAIHGTPLHTPPAVIQIQNTTGGETTSESSDISVASTHSKVLTTKMLPLVLTGSGVQNNVNSNILNNSTLIMASSPTTSVSITSSTSTAGGSTIIKSLPSNMNTSTAPVTVANTNNTIKSTLGTGATVFRKPPNIIKTCIPATTPSKSTSSSSVPHIISNVKLTPVSVGVSGSGSHLATASTFKHVLPGTSSMLRTSVKICQSPNGKVFIQSAGLLDGSKMKLSTSSLPHKIISNAPTGNSSTITSGGHRIAIQKVQIFPAPTNSPTGGSTLQTSGNQVNNRSGKNNVVFMPTAGANVRPVTLSKMGSNILLKSSASQQITPTSPTTTMANAAGDNSMVKSNIVVLDPSPTTITKGQTSQNVKIENTQLINEDIPLDILNMPIVMEPGISVTPSPSPAETVTVLQSNVIEATNVRSPSALAKPIILDQTQLQQPSKTVVLNVDWEMKLDIEQQNQYNKNMKQNKITFPTSSQTTGSSYSNKAHPFYTNSHGNKQKHLNNDYVSMELKSTSSQNIAKITTPTITPTAAAVSTANAVNNLIVLDDSFDDVIIEEHDDDISSIASLDKQQQKNNDIPKILDMQIYQQHDGYDNRVAELKRSNNEDDVEIDVNDDDNGDDAGSKMPQSRQRVQSTDSIVIEPTRLQSYIKEHQQQQRFSQVESEVDAGFDETIVTEIDENTALEYIEENCASTNVSTTVTSTTAIILSKNQTATTSAISKEDVKLRNTFCSNHLVSSVSSEKISVATTSERCESLPIEPTANVGQETTSKNCATEQVEP